MGIEMTGDENRAEASGMAQLRGIKERAAQSPPGTGP